MITEMNKRPGRAIKKRFHFADISSSGNYICSVIRNAKRKKREILTTTSFKFWHLNRESS
jgi:hypothetical protein